MPLLSIYTAGVILLCALLYQVPANAVTLPGIGPFAQLNLWLQLGFWYLLFVVGYYLFRALALLAFRSDASEAPGRQRLALVDYTVRLPSSDWLGLGLLTFLSLALLFVAVMEGIPTPTFFVTSIVLLAYIVQLRSNRQWFTQPGSVVGLRAGPPRAAGQVILHWDPPEGPGFAGVRVIRAAAAPAQNPQEGDLVYEGFRTFLTEEGLEPGTLWHYTVFSMNPEGEAGNHVSLQAGPPPLPPDVEDPHFQADQREIELRWTLPPDPNVRGTLVVRRQIRFPENMHDGELFELGNAEHFRDHRGLQPATVYYYRIFCIDRLRQVSDGVNVEVATKAPSVSDLHVWMDHGRIRLSWTNPAEPIPEIIIVRKVDSPPESWRDGDVVYEGHGTSFTDNIPVEHATTYHYGIYTRYPRAVYGEGIFAHITTPPLPPLIQDFAGIPGRTRVELRWGFPTDPGFGGVHIRRTRNQAARTPEDGDWVHEGSPPQGEQKLDVGLEPDTDYIYTAFSYDEVGYNPDGQTIRIRTRTPPRPINFHRPQIDPITRQVILGWTRMDPTAPFVHLRRWAGQPPGSLNYSEQGGNLLCQGQEVRYVDRDLLTSHTYYYVAYAVDDEGSASEGVMHEVQTPASWNMPIVVHDLVTHERERVSLPESIPLERVTRELLRRKGRGRTENIRLHNRTQNYDYRLDASLADQNTQPGDEITLNYDIPPEEA